MTAASNLATRAAPKDRADRQTMKALCYDHYGAFEQLELKDVAQPEIGPGQVLVRVRATALQSAMCSP